MNKKIISAVLLIAAVLIASVIAVKLIRGCGALQNNIPGFTGSVSSLIAEARELEKKSDLVKARSIYQKLVNERAGSSEVMNWQKKIEDLNIQLLLSPVITPDSALYEIKPGDTLNKIARQFNTTIELIKKSNNLASDIISPGKKLKIWKATPAILVDKSQNILILKTKDEEIIKTYTVATGLNNSTPVGNFKIIEKIPNPPWFKPGAPKPIPAGSPENILGTRWLGINVPSYGIHGTTDPQSLGKQVTQGCVRMNNKDVEELYVIVPKGTEVTIVD